jgi:hypothetical protein
MKEWQVVDLVFMYLYNAEPGKIVQDVYGAQHPTYLKEKESLVRDISRFWPGLDNEHKQRLAEAAIAYYSAVRR